MLRPLAGHPPPLPYRPGTPTAGDNPTRWYTHRQAPSLPLPDTPQIVESKSKVSSLFPGPAPAAHARPSVTPKTLFNWRVWPHITRPQKRAHRRRCHHLMAKHPMRRPRPEPIDMIDMRTPHQHRGHQRQHLTTRPRATHPATQTNHVVHQLFQPQAAHQRRRRQQTPISHQPLIVENHPVTVNIVRYSTHRKCLPTLDQNHFR